MTERELFLALLDLPNQTSRLAYLDHACAGDAVLRAKVEALLQSHDAAGSFLSEPVSPSSKLNANATQEFVAQSTPNDREEGEEHDLSFLAASKRPDSLGRVGHYEVLQILGKGGFGIVFRAYDEVLHRVVALKMLTPQIAATSPARKRFLREARASAAIRHENVVQVYEIGEQPLPYIAMEFIPGETLHQRLNRTGPLDVFEVLRIGRQIAEGLAAAHATDLIHRDIKPANVLIEGGKQRVKLTDFGLARAADDASNSQSGVVAGTPMYMAPEQAKGETLDQRADLFSLGSVLYQMVAGRPPFRASGALAVLKRVVEDDPRPIREIIPETPPWLCDIIAKLHAKDPKDRFQSAREVADLLGECEEQLRTNAKVMKLSGIVPSQPAKRRSRAWKGMAAAALLLPVLALMLTEALGLTRILGNRSPTPGPIVEPPPGRTVKAIDPQGLVGFTDADLLRIAALPPARQIEEVRKELKSRNPGFDAPLDPRLEDQVVVGLEFEGAHVRDISPLRALRSLRSLAISDGPLADLTPLQEMKLTTLELNGCEKLMDLTPLRGMPLEVLSLRHWSGSDLRPLKGMPLKVLNCSGIGQKIDLTQLTELPLETLYVNCTQTSDLTPLKGMPLNILQCFETGVSDLAPLRGLKLTHLNVRASKVSDLSPLKGVPLTSLDISSTLVVDLSPLKEFPLIELHCDYQPQRDAPILREIKTLARINDMPAPKLLRNAKKK